MTKEDKALLDMISYAEGTIGVSNNGYDVLFGNRRIIAGWTKDTTITHGGSDWYVKEKDTTAAGRYQFVFGTWKGDKSSFTKGQNLPMTKDNQNRRGLEIINYTFRNKNIVKTDLINNRNMFLLALESLSKQWSSIPSTTNKGRVTVDDLYDIYKQAINSYS